MTITVEAQYSSSAVSSVATNAGVASFNSNDFTVDANGYVSMSAGHGGITWQDISASQTMGVDNGYICISPGGALSLLLPPTSSLGDLISIILDGSTSFTITQGAGQSIQLGNRNTTAGVSGSITSTQQGDSISMVCSVQNLRWNVFSSMGNLTVV